MRVLICSTSQNRDETIKAAAEAVMREIIGQTAIQTVLTEGRQNVQTLVRQKLQESDEQI